jgi:plasmid maintenance system antidote protein VapI
MPIHIGKIILEHVESLGQNKSEFARRIGVTPQNVYTVFRRSSISTDLLLRISRVLGYNFFQYYAMHEPLLVTDGDLQTYASAQELEKQVNELRNEKELLAQENAYLKELNTLLRGPITVQESTPVYMPVKKAVKRKKAAPGPAKKTARKVKKK